MKNQRRLSNPPLGVKTTTDTRPNRAPMSSPVTLPVVATDQESPGSSVPAPARPPRAAPPRLLGAADSDRMILRSPRRRRVIYPWAVLDAAATYLSTLSDVLLAASEAVHDTRWDDALDRLDRASDVLRGRAARTGNDPREGNGGEP